MTTILQRRHLLVLAATAALGGCATTPVGLALDARQRSQVDRAQDYLNGLGRFQARFDQSGAFGAGNGWIWVDRPGRLRIGYFGPQAQVMVANGATFVIYNPANDATTTMATSRTPLGLLLADRIALSGTVLITRFQDSGDTLSLTLADSTHPNQGTLTVLLQASPMRLIGVTAVDARGRALQMTLSDLRLNPVITPDLFRLPGHPLPNA